MNRELRTARSRRRFRIAWLALAAASLLSISTTMLSAQAAVTSSLSTPLWTAWLQVVVNFAKVLEMAVFVFSGYQFWAGRRERKVADVEAAE